MRCRRVPVPGRGPQRVLRFFRVRPGRPVLMAGSTLRGEEEPVVRAFNRLRATPGGQGALLVIAARHPERFAEVERLCRQEGLSTVRRTELPIDNEPRVDAVILDTIGELAHLYQIATAVFVGGSIVPAGGHNILEPAAHGKAIVFGPHMENFSEIAETFLANDAAVQGAERRGAGGGAAEPDGRPVRRARLGAAARALVVANRGAKDKTMAAIADVLPRNRAALGRGAPLPRGPLSALSALYGRVASARRAWFNRRPHTVRRLPHAGRQRRQSGRSAAAARRRWPRWSPASCCEDGERPAILSRGYARRERLDGVRGGQRRARRPGARVDARATNRSCWRRPCRAYRCSCARTGIWPGSWRTGSSAPPCRFSTTASSICSSRATWTCCS